MRANAHWIGRIAAPAFLCLAAGACGGGDSPANIAAEEASDEAAIITDGAPPAGFTWPQSLTIVGHGYPTVGNPCRQVGESAATSNYLDDSAILVGCPGAGDTPAAQAIVSDKRGRIVGSVDDVTLISVPISAPGG